MRTDEIDGESWQECLNREGILVTNQPDTLYWSSVGDDDFRFLFGAIPTDAKTTVRRGSFFMP